ncbi:hypothetical protein FHG87_018342, partial [Trinorchestia longiramus]
GVSAVQNSGCLDPVGFSNTNLDLVGNNHATSLSASSSKLPDYNASHVRLANIQHGDSSEYQSHNSLLQHDSHKLHSSSSTHLDDSSNSIHHQQISTNGSIRVESDSLNLHVGGMQDTDALSTNDAFNTPHALARYVDESSSQSDNLVSYTPGIQDDAGDLGSFSVSDPTAYTVSSESSSNQMVTYSDEIQTENSAAEMSQYHSGLPSSSSPSLVHYSEGQEGLTISAGSDQILLPDNSLVNFVELGGGLNIDPNSLVTNSIIMRPEYAGDGAEASSISVVSANDETSSGLALLDNRPRDGSGGAADAYIAADADSNVGAATQYLQIGTMGGQTISVPLSFLNTQSGLALLQQLGVVRVDADQNTIFLPQVATESLQSAPVNSAAVPVSSVSL